MTTECSNIATCTACITNKDKITTSKAKCQRKNKLNSNSGKQERTELNSNRQEQKFT